MQTTTPATDRAGPRKELLELLAQVSTVGRLSQRVPVDIEAIARALGAKSVSKADIPAAGMLLPVGKQFMILVNRRDGPDRQRFSCAHEIAHALFDPAFSPALRQLALSSNMPSASSQNIEKKCDEVASLLLMPNPVFREQVDLAGASIGAITKLARTFATSVQATALRFVDEVDEHCLLVISQADRSESGFPLRVKWSSHNVLSAEGRPKYYIPRGAHLKLHTASVAYRAGAVQADLEAVELGNLRVNARTESRRFGTGDNKYVMTLVFPARA